MTAFKGLGTYGNAAGVVTPLDHKLSNAGMVTKATATTIRAGLFWPGTATIVSGKANMSYDVAAFTGVTQRSAAAGAVFGGNDGTLNLATDVTGAALVAPGSNSRYHLVFWWHREYSIDGTDSNPVIGVLQGTAAASPTVPSLASYPGAVELARILVPAGVTATNSGTTITQTAPFTATAGGVIPFRNTTERDAGTYLAGQLGWLLDSGTLFVYSGSAWKGAAPGFLSVAASTANNTSGSVSSLSMVTIPTIPCSASVVLPVAQRAKVTIRFEFKATAVGSGIAIGAILTGATTFTPAADTVFAPSVTSQNASADWAPYTVVIDYSLNAGTTAVTVGAQVIGVGSTRSIRHIQLFVEPLTS